MQIDHSRWWKDVASFRLDSRSGLFVAVLKTDKLVVLRDYRSLLLLLQDNSGSRLAGFSAQTTSDKVPMMIDIGLAPSRTQSVNSIACHDTLISIRPGTEQLVLCRPHSPEILMIDFSHASSPGEVMVHCLGRIDEVMAPYDRRGQPDHVGRHRRLTTLPGNNAIIEAYATRQSQVIKELVQAQNVSTVEVCGLQSTWASVHLQTRWRDPEHGLVTLTHCFDFATTALAHKEPALTARRLSSHPFIRPIAVNTHSSSADTDDVISPSTSSPLQALRHDTRTLSFSAFA